MILLNNFSVLRTLAFTTAILVSSCVVAQSSSSVESQLLSCSKGSTDAVRLACYDGLADSLRAVKVATNDTVAPAREPETVSATTRPVEPVLPKVDPSTGVPVQSGNEQPVVKKAETFDTGVAQKQSIRVMVEKTKRNARGDWYFYFDNGEVWKQIDSRTRRIPPLPIAATVSRGIFSSYKLHIDGEVWAMKVRRVK